MTESTSQLKCPFTQETFVLLEQFKQNSTQDFYYQHKKQFVEYVEKPLRKIYIDVISALPNKIKKRIDTTQESVLPPFYVNSTCCYQLNYIDSFNEKHKYTYLFINIISKRFYFGLFISARSPNNREFIQNIKDKKNKQLIIQHFLPIDGLYLHCEPKMNTNQVTSLSNWLQELIWSNSNIRVFKQIEARELLNFPYKDLVNHIQYTLEKVFILLLVAAEKQPIQEIEKYMLELDDYIEPDFSEIYKKICSEKLIISEITLRRYHLSLKIRKFVILSGISGTGKTWLTKVYAEVIGAKYLLVPVAPNWNTNEDLLGYLNPINGTYHHTEFSRFLESASEEYKQAELDHRIPQPYHVVLDEMNLARVEYYFAKFLSLMEVRMREGITKIEIEPGKEVLLPPNFYFIGTVNVDETTHGFADKIYDRAQMIELEFKREDLKNFLDDVPYQETLMEIWDAIHEVAPFAFRVLDEIKNYIQEAETLNVQWKEALDEQLLQKILPKFKGADGKLEEALDKFMKIAEDNNFNLSHTKSLKMFETLKKYGFTSYF